MSGEETIAERKKMQRRRGDRSQVVRRSVQCAFFALNVWIGVAFYGYVRYCETGGATMRFARPAGVEGWLPIASLMNLKYFLATGRLPNVLCTGMLLLSAFLVISLVLRKSFCSWLCPVGTLSEWLWMLGQKVLGRSLRLPRWVDLPLRSLKYLLLAFFVFSISMMSAGAIEQFLAGPYGAVADVQMLDFFRYMSGTAAAIFVALVALSVLMQNFWCRYLCPYGALMGLAGLLSPARIARVPDTCIDCGKCSKACPSLLPVDRLVTIRSAECTSCLLCIAACPVEPALEFKLGRRKTISPVLAAVAIAILFFAAVIFGRVTHHWGNAIPESTAVQMVQHAAEVMHP